MNKIKKYAGTAFGLLCIVAMLATWFVFESEIEVIDSVKTVFCVIGDAVLIYAPYWIISRRYRWTALLPLVVNTIWILASSWYFRFWGEILGVDSLLLANNVNGMVVESVVGLFRPIDLFYLLVPVAMFVCYFKWWRKDVTARKFNMSYKLIMLTASVLLFIVAQLCRSGFDFSRFKNLESNKVYLQKNGTLAYGIASLNNALSNGAIDLSWDQKIAIEEYIEDTPKPQHFVEFENNKGKNIILVVVESLNAKDIPAQVGGRLVAPVLNSLINDYPSVSALDVTTQVRQGGSGDGQLMVNAGLLPLSHHSTAILFGTDNTFETLVTAFGRKDNVAVFADDGKGWNKINTFHSYGFDRAITSLEYEAEFGALGADGAMFAMAESLLPELSKPFFLELLTISMHVPFATKDIPNIDELQWIEAAGESEAKINYLKTLNYFDSSLGKFIDRLKAVGLWDNTLLFVVSDHSQNIAQGEEKADLTSEPMAFIAANCGLKREVLNKVGQIDVYPTILQIADVKKPGIWRGIGHSILDSIAPSPERLEAAESISELIIKGNYFENNTK